MTALSGAEPTTPRLFRVDLIRTLRYVRDLEIPIPVLGRQCLVNDIGGPSQMADSCRPRTSTLVSLQKSGSARVRNGQSSSSRPTNLTNSPVEIGWKWMDK
jgi:hypothetical protein